MKIEDPEIWTSFASYISQRYDVFDIRNLSNIVYSLYQISHHKPAILNFDDLFSELELPFILKLDEQKGEIDS
jgi:hypothetical protein